MLDNLLVEIAIVEEVHDDTETGGLVLEKGLFVTDNAPVPTKCVTPAYNESPF